MKSPALHMTFAFEDRVMVNPQVSLLNLTLDVGIPGDVVWSLIDGKHSVSVPHHGGLFVVRVDDCLDVEIDGGTADCFDVAEDNPVKEDGGAAMDIILSRRKCGF